jgi:hypothetical protein
MQISTSADARVAAPAIGGFGTSTRRAVPDAHAWRGRMTAGSAPEAGERSAIRLKASRGALLA